MRYTIERRYIEIETLEEALLGIPKLPPREALVIILWCGLHGGTPWTMRQLAERFRLSRQQIQLLKDQAVKRLRTRARIYEPRG